MFMKKTFLVGIIATLAAMITGPAALPEAEPAISARGPHHNVWTRSVDARLPNGRVVKRNRSFTELASGLNHWSDENQSWLPSTEEIEILNGFGNARQGQLKV